MCKLQAKDVLRRNRADHEEGGVKMVMGPGTGLGEAFLIKSEFSKVYEIYPSEGAHVDFAVLSEEDFRLKEFAKDFVEHSENVENQRGRGPINRVSVERLCAGPAVPLIYEFYKKEFPDLKRVLEEGDQALHPNDI